MTDKPDDFNCGAECSTGSSGNLWPNPLARDWPKHGLIFPKGPQPLGWFVTPVGGGEAQRAVIWDRGKRVGADEKRDWWGVLTVEECPCQGEAREDWQPICGLCDGLGRFGRLH